MVFHLDLGVRTLGAGANSPITNGHLKIETSAVNGQQLETTLASFVQKENAVGSIHPFIMEDERSSQWFPNVQGKLSACRVSIWG